MSSNIADEITHKIVTEVQETMDDFIFTTIQPFCEGAVQRKISKKELVNALLLYEKARKLLGVNNEV